MSGMSERVIKALEAHKGVLYPAVLHLMAEAWQEGADAMDDPCETAIPCGDCKACNTPLPLNPYAPEAKP